MGFHTAGVAGFDCVASRRALLEQPDGNERASPGGDVVKRVDGMLSLKYPRTLEV